jgi:putative membrane protein
MGRLMTRLKNLTTAQIRKFIWIFFSVGIVGLGMPWTRTFFTYLVPFNFLITFIIILITDKSDQKRLIPFAVAVLVLGYVIEAVAVNTGIIFGDYSYGSSLGPKIFGTPLIIGWNWIMLVYCSTIIVTGFTSHRYFISFLATVLMVVFDMVLEGPAGVLDMWNWDWAHVPIQNFIAWFIIAWLFNGALQLSKIRLSNPIAGTLFSAQFVFFLFLNLVFFFEQAVS